MSAKPNASAQIGECLQQSLWRYCSDHAWARTAAHVLLGLQQSIEVDLNTSTVVVVIHTHTQMYRNQNDKKKLLESSAHENVIAAVHLDVEELVQK